MADENSFPGSVAGEVVEARFPFSGQTQSVKKYPGDRVSAGEILAILDPKIIQTELDRELSDYERIRADFELFTRRQGEPQTDVGRFEKIRQQSLLDVSVRAVELVKLRLDQTGLKSPVNGVVMDIGGIRPGLFVTPSANPVKILDDDSLIFSVVVSWADLPRFSPGLVCQVRLDHQDIGFPATVLSFIPPADTKKSPEVHLHPDTDLRLYPGMSGRVTLPE